VFLGKVVSFQFTKSLFSFLFEIGAMFGWRENNGRYSKIGSIQQNALKFNVFFAETEQ